MKCKLNLGGNSLNERMDSEYIHVFINTIRFLINILSHLVLCLIANGKSEKLSQISRACGDMMTKCNVVS